MFCLLPTKCKQQQQIALLIISFFLYVNGIRNEGSNMLQQQQQPLLHATIENSNYQRSSSSVNSLFKPSPLLEFTLDDATSQKRFKPTYENVKYATILPATPSTFASSGGSTTAIKEALVTNTETPNDNRRYSPIYPTTAAAVEQQFAFPNEQQQQALGIMPQQQTPQFQRQQQSQYHNQQIQQQQEQHFAQQLTEMPIYIYKDPYTNENYHYTPTEPNNVNVAATVASASPAATYNRNDYNNNGGYGFKQQQHQYQTVGSQQDNQEYLVHSSMTVGSHPQQQRPNPYLSSDKDVYLKRPGMVYDESYIPHPNSLQEKKSESGQSTKINKISYDSHDYPPPSYHQQQTSNFLPTPVPDIPATARPTPPPVRRPPVYATPPPPPPPQRQPPSYVTSRPPQQDYRPRPPPPPEQASVYGHQQYLQSSQNALPNYANNLDNYLSNKQQTEYYRPERPPPYLQQQQQQQPLYETIPPPFRQQPQQQQQQLQQYQQSPYPPYRPQPQPSQQTASYPLFENPQYAPPRPPPSRPSYNNYYDYQIGEVPPQTQGAVNYPYPQPPNGPYRPPPTQQPSGLATLVQYAPQFTSLLLGGGGGGGSSSNSNSALGSLFGALTGAATSPQSSSPPSSSSYNRRPVNSQLIKALENIARNDDLQCVPKVVCQMIAAQTERGQLPSFITSPTITNFLSGFPASSPALIYGRAALLGISGGDRSCHHTYVKCPKNEYEIIYYLNNHRGGFFKFFSEPEPQQSFNQQSGNQDSSQSGAGSLFSILSALTGNQVEPATTPRPRPKPQPQPASSDITGTIGSFFTQLLSDYMGGGATVEYQRRRRRSTSQERVLFEEENDDKDENFNFNQSTDKDYQDDEEDAEDTQQNVEFVYEPEYADDEDNSKETAQGRVVHKPTPDSKGFKFFPDTKENAYRHEKTKDDLTTLIEKFNEFNKGRKLKFPSPSQEREYINVANDFLREAKDLDVQETQPQLNYGHQYTNYQEGIYDNTKVNKKVKFLDDDHHSLYPKEMNDLITSESTQHGTKVKFPDREGKILNRPYYAASFSYNQLQQQQQSFVGTNDKFVVSNSQRPSDYNEADLYDTNVSPLKSGKDDKLVLPNSQRPGHYYNQPQGSKDYNINNQPEEYDYYDEFGQPQRPEDLNLFGQSQRPVANSGYDQSQRPGVYNTHVTKLNSISNYLSNSNTNNNYYGGLPLRRPAANSNHFLPTPPPETDGDNEYNNSLYPNNNYNSNNQNFNNRYSSSNSHKAQTYSGSSNSNYNRQTYNSAYRPLRNPPSSSTSQSSNSYNSAKIQRYPSNSNTNSNNNRYHSSLYTTRRTTTTPRPKNDNVYITNSRGETEYYIRPDGRKVYL